MEREKAKQVVTAVMKALRNSEELKALGFTPIEPKGTKFATDSDSVTLGQLSLVGISNLIKGAPETQYALDFRRFCCRVDLKPSDLGREVTYQGRKYVITGWISRTRENNVQAKDVLNGKFYRLPNALFCGRKSSGLPDFGDEIPN